MVDRVLRRKPFVPEVATSRSESSKIRTYLKLDKKRSKKRRKDEQKKSMYKLLKREETE